VFSELRWEVIVCFVDIGGIDDHYCLNFLFCVNSNCHQFHQYQQNKQSPLIITHWTKKESLNSNGHQFHQYQQNKQSPLLITHWEVIVCFVDIGGIDDHYCLNFLFCVQWVKMRGDCLFCWYWWNWWQLLFKLFLINSTNINKTNNHLSS
jgi:hypothetical protein